MQVRRIPGWTPDDALEHKAIKGQKKGVRRYQYANGTYTPAGNERYRPKKSMLAKVTGINFSEEGLMMVGVGAAAAGLVLASGVVSLPAIGTTAASLSGKSAVSALLANETFRNIVLPSIGAMSIANMVEKILDDELGHSDYLEHHGIKGQEWGVRHGPPYPLNSKTAKQVKRVAKYKKDREELKNGKNKKVTGVSHLATRHDRSWQERMRNFTDLPTTGQNVAEYITERGTDAQFLNDNDKIYGRDGGVYKNHSWISNEDLRLVNYDYGKPGTTSNCCKCSAALELRRRGINVTAGRQTQGSLTTALQYWFDGAVEYKERSDTLETRIKKGGRRSTGALDFRYPNGAGGHSMYVQVQNDGEPRYYDGQIGKSFSSLDDVYNFYGFDRNATAKYTRLDNATPNYKHMSEDSVLRIDFTDKSHNGVYNEKEKRMVDTW